MKLNQIITVNQKKVIKFKNLEKVVLAHLHSFVKTIWL